MSASKLFNELYKGETVPNKHTTLSVLQRLESSKYKTNIIALDTVLSEIIEKYNRLYIASISVLIGGSVATSGILETDISEISVEKNIYFFANLLISLSGIAHAYVTQNSYKNVRDEIEKNIKEGLEMLVAEMPEAVTHVMQKVRKNIANTRRHSAKVLIA